MQEVPSILTDQITEGQLLIRIHRIGGIGGYEPTEALIQLGHVELVVYDADEDSLSA